MLFGAIVIVDFPKSRAEVILRGKIVPIQGYNMVKVRSATFPLLHRKEKYAEVEMSHLSEALLWVEIDRL
ncbi:MAG: hypothetical protein JWO48_3724 [Bryobacterales bacterium]|nr:hypothetical protein [Bryobacterales bacterium]